MRPAGWRAVALACEAALELAYARLAITGRFGRSWRSALGSAVADGAAPAAPIDHAGDATAAAVGWAIAAAGNRLAMRPTCLPQAVAAQRMLRRRGVRSRALLGARRDEDRDLDLHAWVVAGDRVVCGARGHGQFVPVAVFESAPPPPRDGQRGRA